MKYPIFVPSKGRGNAKICKTIQNLNNENIDFLVFLEPQDLKKYQEFVESSKIINIGKNNKGISFIRQFILDFARKNKHNYYWQIDDDIKGFAIVENGNPVKVSFLEAINFMENYLVKIEKIGILSPARPISIFWNKNGKEFDENKGKINQVVLTNTKTGADYDLQSDGAEDIIFSIKNIMNFYKTISLNSIIYYGEEEGIKDKKIIGGCSDLYKDEKRRHNILLNLCNKYDFLKIIKRPFGEKLKVNWKKLNMDTVKNKQLSLFTKKGGDNND